MGRPLILEMIRDDEVLASIERESENLLKEAFESNFRALSDRRIEVITALNALSDGSIIRIKNTFITLEKSVIFSGDSALRNGFYNLGRMVNKIPATLVPSSWTVEQTKKMIYFLFCFRNEPEISRFAVDYFSGWEDRRVTKKYDEGCRILEEKLLPIANRLEAVRKEAEKCL